LDFYKKTNKNSFVVKFWIQKLQMKRLINKLLILLIGISFGGCQSMGKSFLEGWVILALLLGIPVFFLMFLGDVVSGIREKTEKGSFGSNFFPSLFYLIFLSIIIFGFIKSCSG